jgi:hypothetical protein
VPELIAEALAADRQRLAELAAATTAAPTTKTETPTDEEVAS